MSDHNAQINFTIDENSKELAKEKLGHGGLSKVLRERMHEVAYGEEISKHERLQKRLAELREEKDSKRAEIRELQADVEEQENTIARIEERLDGMERREDKYDATLEMLEETLYAGGRVFEDHGQVIKAAKIGDKEPKGVIEELRNRNPSVPEHAFVQKLRSNKQWDGIEQGGGPP